MKNKKIISLISALAMIFSMFSAFTVVNAEVTKGIELAGTLSADGKTLTVDATAKGMDASLLSFGIKFAVPEGVEDATKITYTAGATGGTWTPTLVNGIYTLSFFNMSPLEFKDGKLATIKIELNAPLANNYELKLEDTAMIQDTTNGKLAVSTGMDNSAVTVPKWQDPNKKPDKVDRPAPATPTPGGDDPVAVPAGEKGIDLVATLNKENTVLTVDATAKGMDAALLSFGIKFAVPEGVEDVTKITYTAGAEGGTWTPTLVNGIYTLSFFNMSPLEFKDGKLATIKIELSAPATKPIAITLDSTAMIQDTTNGKLAVSTGAMEATSAVAIPSKEEPKPVNTVALKKYVGAGYEAAIDAVPKDEPVYLTVDVKMKDGKHATYGTHYKAYYPDANTPLTEAEYNDLIHGYKGKDMKDVINKLIFKTFSADVTDIIVSLNAANHPEQLVKPVENTKIKPDKEEPTQKPVVASMTLKAEDKEIAVNTNSRITATIKDATGATAGTTVTFEIIEGADSIEFSADPDKATYTAEIKEDNKAGRVATARISATKKTGKAKVKATYTYTDKDDKETIEEVVTITVKKADSNKGGGNIISGPTGPIAQGSAVNNAQSGTINFVDLDTVTWAQDAILRLVDKKVINGRSNTIFDPNGTVTRAEFAKMVVLGFGLTGGTAGNFSDVDTSAWYNTYVQIGYANDVISGYDDGTFRPNGLISRQEMAAMISRAVKAANKSLSATVAAVDFTDVNPSTEWGYAEISALQAAGVINGMTATTFEPYSNATRAQAAVIIDRAMTNAK